MQPGQPLPPASARGLHPASEAMQRDALRTIMDPLYGTLWTGPSFAIIGRPCAPFHKDMESRHLVQNHMEHIVNLVNAHLTSWHTLVTDWVGTKPASVLCLCQGYAQDGRLCEPGKSAVR